VKTRSREPAKPRNRRSAKFGNLLKFEFGVMTYEDFLDGEIHESVGSQVKDVVSKSPGLVCELVTGL
jgi:hypothetical protein